MVGRAIFGLVVIGIKLVNMNSGCTVGIHFSRRIPKCVEFTHAECLDHISKIIGVGLSLSLTTNRPKRVFDIIPDRASSEAVYKTHGIAVRVVNEPGNPSVIILRFDDPSRPVSDFPFICLVGPLGSVAGHIRDLTSERPFFRTVLAKLIG